MTLIDGEDKGIIAENVKSLMKKGHSQPKAIKLASAHASRSRAVKKPKKVHVPKL